MIQPDAGRPWIRQLNPGARLRLLCFSYAGGGTVDFRPWQEHFPAFVEVCPVVYPGRETRMSEPAATDIHDLVDPMLRDLAPLLEETPVALYGHSMGAWVAFELARALRRAGRPEPVHLFVAARRAPDHPSERPPLYTLSDDAFIEAVQERYGAIPPQILAHPQILAMFRPTLRADFTLLDTYVCAPEPPLAVPITALRGSGDTMVDRAGIEGWSAHTSGSFEVRQVPGGHFFLRDARDLLCDAVAGVLRRYH